MEMQKIYIIFLEIYKIGVSYPSPSEIISVNPSNYYVIFFIIIIFVILWFWKWYMYPRIWQQKDESPPPFCRDIGHLKMLLLPLDLSFGPCWDAVVKASTVALFLILFFSKCDCQGQKGTLNYFTNLLKVAKRHLQITFPKNTF